MYTFEVNLSNPNKDIEHIKSLYPEAVSAKLLIDDVDKKSFISQSIRKILLAQEQLKSFDLPEGIDIDELADESNL